MKEEDLRRIIRGKRGQTVIEYLLATVALTFALVGMYAYLQKGLKGAFKDAGIKILTPYCNSGPC